MKVDWDDNINQICGIYWLTDKQVKEGLLALKHARELYGELDINDVPDCILLYDNHNEMIHKIRTKEGKPCTVAIRPKQNKMLYVVGALIFIFSITTGSITYYLINR